MINLNIKSIRSSSILSSIVSHSRTFYTFINNKLTYSKCIFSNTFSQHFDSASYIVMAVNTLILVYKPNLGSSVKYTTISYYLLFFPVLTLVLNSTVVLLFYSSNVSYYLPVFVIFTLQKFIGDVSIFSDGTKPGLFGKVFYDYQSNTPFDYLSPYAEPERIKSLLLHLPQFSQNIRTSDIKFIQVEMQNIISAFKDLDFNSPELVQVISNFFIAFSGFVYNNSFPMANITFSGVLTNNLGLHKYRNSDDNSYFIQANALDSFASDTTKTCSICLLKLFQPNFYYSNIA